MKPALALLLLFLPAPALLRGAEAPEQTVITSDSLESTSTDTETTTVCTGNVVVTGTNLRMTCDWMRTITTKLANKTDTIGNPDQLKYMLATGHVHIWQGDREAICGRAEFLPAEDKVVLTENPSVIDHGNNSVGTGEVIEMHRNQRTVTGKKVRITLPPMKDLGYDKNQQPPAPQPAEAAPAGPMPASPTQK
ncbi:MAG: LptA/OstA family protein [Opitutaceae bacterium]|jgi:lipopolysaccharide export system protein LptA